MKVGAEGFEEYSCDRTRMMHLLLYLDTGKKKLLRGGGLDRAGFEPYCSLCNAVKNLFKCPVIIIIGKYYFSWFPLARSASYLWKLNSP